MKWVVVIIVAILTERIGELVLFKKELSTNSKVLIVVLTAILAMISIPYLIEGTTMLIILEALILLVTTKTLVDLKPLGGKKKEPQ